MGCNAFGVEIRTFFGHHKPRAAKESPPRMTVANTCCPNAVVSRIKTSIRSVLLQVVSGVKIREEVTMTFTKEQRAAVETSGTVPMTIDGIECVVLRADLYDKVRTVISDGLSHEELRAMLARSAEGSDWLDASMDAYDEYDSHR